MNIKLIVPNADYVIYVFIPDHLRRNLDIMPNKIFNEYTAIYYIDKNNKLKLQKNNKFIYFLNSLYFIRLQKETTTQKNMFSDKSIQLFCEIIKRMNYKIKKMYPNAKFIIFVYLDWRNDVEKTKELFKRIKTENENIEIVFNTDFPCGEDILSRKYLAPDNIHPSKEVWEKFLLPEFVKKYIY